MVRFNESEIKKAIKTIRASLKANKGLPSTVTMKDTDGKSRKLSKAQYNGLLEARNVFRLKNGRMPNYTTLNSTANNPIVLNYQDDSVSCACASFNMCVQMLYEWIDEKKIKQVFQTGSSGTAPSQVISGAKKLGYNVTKIDRNSKAVKKALDKGYPIMAHIDTIKAPCLGYAKNYGHWIMIHRINDTSYYVLDPTKGSKVCKFANIDKAMLDRTIYYYKVTIV
ncbi:MAG: C39 family peptidase [Paludibacteraceae bacterium]|nr:C39 family peptidase [Paludibacteraceae bacterium]